MQEKNSQFAFIAKIFGEIYSLNMENILLNANYKNRKK